MSSLCHECEASKIELKHWFTCVTRARRQGFVLFTVVDDHVFAAALHAQYCIFFFVRGGKGN